MSPTLSIQIVTWNSAAVIEPAKPPDGALVMVAVLESSQAS